MEIQVIWERNMWGRKKKGQINRVNRKITGKKYKNRFGGKKEEKKESSK